MMKELSEKLKSLTMVELHELANLLESDPSTQIGIVFGKKPVVHPNTGGNCPTGMHWDNILKKCVLDEG